MSMLYMVMEEKHIKCCLTCQTLVLLPVCSEPLYTNCHPRDHFVYAPSHWEMALQCNAISDWLGAYTEWSLHPKLLPFRRPHWRLSSSYNSNIFVCYFISGFPNPIDFCVSPRSKHLHLLWRGKQIGREMIQPRWQLMTSRDHFLYGPSQWEVTLHCNVISHWLGPYMKWFLTRIVIGSDDGEDDYDSWWWWLWWWLKWWCNKCDQVL